jgi:hypothetical protein
MAERDDFRADRLRPQFRARKTFGKVARVAGGECERPAPAFASSTSCAALSASWLSAAACSSARSPDGVTRLGWAETGRSGRVTSCAASALSSRTNATLMPDLLVREYGTPQSPPPWWHDLKLAAAADFIGGLILNQGIPAPKVVPTALTQTAFNALKVAFSGLFIEDPMQTLSGSEYMFFHGLSGLLR